MMRIVFLLGIATFLGSLAFAKPIPPCSTGQYIIAAKPQKMTKAGIMALLKSAYSFRVMDLFIPSRFTVDDKSILLVLTVRAQKDSWGLEANTVLNEISQIPGVSTIECGGKSGSASSN